MRESARVLPRHMALNVRTKQRARKVFNENINLHTYLFHAVGVVMQSILEAAKPTVL
jgi:hypothetical protein